MGNFVYLNLEFIGVRQKQFYIYLAHNGPLADFVIIIIILYIYVVSNVGEYQPSQVGSVVLSNAENGQMDFYSTSQVSADDLSIKHVHCWHTDDMFSKFMFGTGKYDDEDFTPQGAMATVRDRYVVLDRSDIHSMNRVQKKNGASVL